MSSVDLAGHGKMKTAYFWPVYGEEDEVCFPYRGSRSAENVTALLGARPPPGTVLVTDGYPAYAKYAKASGVTHAQCWVHARREVFEALFAQVEATFAELGGLLPATPFTTALRYLRDRKTSLSVFLEDPDVPLDTNHLERALRPVPMGRKNWNFCWTELGARDVGIAQSLLVTCRLHRIDPYDNLVDVLQRVGDHPASRVAELTPRRWKALFAKNPLRSPLHTRTSWASTPRS